MPASANLDLFRAIAVLCVFTAHLSAAMKWGVTGSLGRFGVILFFVHTSFVLMSSLERLERSGLRQNWRLGAVFGVRRIFRIYPLSIFCILLVTIFRIPSSPGGTYSWIGIWHFLSNLALIQSLTYSPDVLDVLWSLPLEVEMYCLLPLIYFVIRSKRRLSFLVFLLAIASALVIPKFVGRLSVFAYAPCFSAGVLAYALSKAVKPRFPAWVWPLGVGSAIILFGPLDNISLRHKLPLAWVLALGLGLLVPLCKELKVPSITRVCHFVAKYSYGIYLSHTIIFWLSIHRMESMPISLRIAVLIVGSVGAPIAMYHLIEDPFIRIGVELGNRLRSSSDLKSRLWHGEPSAI